MAHIYRTCKYSFIPLTIILILSVVLCYSCKRDTIPKNKWDFEDVRKSGELTIITLSSSFSYFIYRDEPMGYDYDLCNDFCEHYGLKLNVKVAENSSRLIEMLMNGEGDVVAYPMAIENALKDSVTYCGPELVSHQVLIQRSLKGDTLVKDVTDLIGKEVFVKHNTKYHKRLLNLNAELGNGILITDVEKDTVTSEDLIEMVSEGKIKYTVSDAYVARLNKTYYRNIDVSLALSFEQRSSWIVRKDMPNLGRALNEWVEANENRRVFNKLTKKYFELSKLPFDGQYIIPKNLPKGHISAYDNLFRKYAEDTSFDWHLLAAIAYQESRFHPSLTSWAGATGLMGLMPRTAQSLGISVDDRLDPELSIMASVKLLNSLESMFKSIQDEDEKLKFVLAAYNGGNGHIADARALVRKYGGDPNHWEDVKKYLLLKSNPDYYNDPVVKNGYFRGNETARYVDQVIMNRKKFGDHLKPTK